MAKKERAPARKRRKLEYRDGEGCLVCGYTGYLTLHHIKKVSEGGSNSIQNLCLLCTTCHTYWHQNEADNFGDWVRQTRTFLTRIIYDD